MDISPVALLTNWVPHIPRLVKTILQAPFGWSPNSEHQDLLTEVLVQGARPVLQTPAALLKSQKLFLTDIGVWGQKWVCNYTVPPPENQIHSNKIPISSTGGIATSNPISVEQAVAFAINFLATHSSEKSCPIPPFAERGIETEWTGHRAHARRWSRTPHGLADRDIYKRIISELPDGENSPVILFAHGGAFCLMDPSNHRATAVRLARLTNSRVVNVRYRLSPQAIFPAALMDMFLAYLALLCPPPAAYHEPVPASKIVLAGDSSGGNLVTALQVLLNTLAMHGRTDIVNPWSKPNDGSVIKISDMPTTALSLVSPWLDITRSLPSCTLNSRYDFIAPPKPLEPSLTTTSPMFPPDEIWPAKPVRTETYCEAVMCAHPLVSPLITPREVLARFPASYVCTGWEGMTDETEVFLRRIAEAQMAQQEDKETCKSLIEPDGKQSTHSGTEAFFDGYIGMPHVFSSIEYNAAGADANRNRGNHILRALGRHRCDPPSGVSSSDATQATLRATWTNVKTMQLMTVSMKDLGMTSEFSGYTREAPLTDEYVFGKVEEGRVFRVELEQRLREDELARIEQNSSK